jgi:hypothetical protein
VRSKTSRAGGGCGRGGDLFGTDRLALEDRRASPTLLADVRQFMGEQARPPCRLRPELSRAEDDVAADGVGAGGDLPRGLLGDGAGVDPDPGVIVAEARLEVVAGRLGERPALARGSKSGLGDGRR